jgi:hypothetical protein
MLGCPVSKSAAGPAAGAPGVAGVAFFMGRLPVGVFTCAQVHEALAVPPKLNFNRSLCIFLFL